MADKSQAVISIALQNKQKERDKLLYVKCMQPPSQVTGKIEYRISRNIKSEKQMKLEQSYKSNSTCYLTKFLIQVAHLVVQTQGAEWSVWQCQVVQAQSTKTCWV